MNMIYKTNNLENIIIEVGRAILYGPKQERRIIKRGKRNGLYITWKGDKRYLSQINDMVVTNGVVR